ncbi:MFS transporter [Celerinatantimonas sp. YJH-8]|uniref:MFS transporter n=1 Tax=Celerinatantimonas sp. YJH-8 TaxID=3228714 RepID=UPI0038BEED63
MSTQNHKFTFFSASLSLMTIFIAAGAPIPLYGIYQAQNGITYLDLSLSSVVYFVGAVLSMLICGRLSNYYGRQSISLLSLICAAIATISFLHVDSAAPLLIGRFSQGLATGLASTALAAWIVDCSKSVPVWIAPAVISCGPMTGLTIGGIGSGILVQFAPMPRQLPFYIVLALLAICIGLLCKSQETMTRKSGALASLKPRFGLPPSARKAYPLAACTFISTWSVGGFIQAFGPAIAQEQLHSSSAIVAALTFASLMAPSSLGASLVGNYKPEQTQQWGLLLFTGFLWCLIGSLFVGSLTAFLIAGILTGIAMGATLTGGIQTMVQGLEPDDRANVLSVIYVTSYVGAAGPTLFAGHYAETYKLANITAGYGVMAIIACVIVFSAGAHALLKHHAIHSER